MFSLLAPAKINLFLKVLYQRPDGYHEIESLMQAVSLFDRLTFSPASKIIVQTRGAKIAQKDNLVTKALLLLQKYAGIKKGLRVVIDKNIPTAAGLGGGSSDAATALLGACRLWQIPLSLSELSYLGAQIGSDVPFFFTSGQALAAGRGEKLAPLSFPTDYFLVLACPKFHISTPWAYQELKLGLTNSKSKANFFRRRIGENLRRPPHALTFSNDLEAPVIRRFPEVERIKEALLAKGLEPVLMSGSGPAVWAALKTGAEGNKLPTNERRQRKMVEKKLVRLRRIFEAEFFIVRPIRTCLNIPVGGQPA